MKKVVTFGEIMLRLATPGNQRFCQAARFDATFGGGEANVSVSLANYGYVAQFVTRMPKNDLATSCLMDLHKYGVRTDHVVFGGERLGIYFLETGAVSRPGKVVYDRAHSAMAEIRPGMIDWERVFEGASWFHWTGITPAISAGAAEACQEAVEAANRLQVPVSCDLNHRNKLWKYGKTAAEVMPPLVAGCDVVIGNEEDAEKVFGIKPDHNDVEGGKLNREGYIDVAKKLSDRFGFEKVAITLRESISASDNNWAAMLYTDGEAYFSKKYAVHIVDRVGGGDSFGAGLIYGLMNGYDNQKTIEFAVAASCLKHSIETDFNYVSVDEVKALMKGDGSGRVQR